MRPIHQTLASLFTCMLLVTALSACGGKKQTPSDSAGMGAGGGSGGSAGVGGDASASCTQACKSANALACSNDVAASCVPDCQALYDGATCRTEARAFTDCTAAAQASDWACDAKGEAGPKPNVCATQYTALTTCLGI